MNYTITAKDKAGNIIATKTYSEGQFHGISAFALLRQVVATDKPVVDEGGSIIITASPDGGS